MSFVWKKVKIEATLEQKEDSTLAIVQGNALKAT